MSHIRALAVSLVALSTALAVPCAAQDATAAEPAADPAAIPAASAGAQVFEPAFFTQYAPRNALDMVAQVPGFQIREGGGQDGQQRGLGEANANVVVNSQRLASKSEGVREQLARIPAQDVVRIELVDGATLAIPGLSGQVLNVITAGSSKISGQFRWEPEVRAHFAKPSLLGGEVSVKGASGPVEYAVSLSNQPGRGAVGGTYEVYDRDGTQIEDRYDILSVYGERPKAAVELTLDGPGSSVGHLNANYNRNYFDIVDDELRNLVVGDDYRRVFTAHDRGYGYEIAGDYEFPIGPGRLKLIGLERYNRASSAQTFVDSLFLFEPDIGGRYAQTVRSGEHIARGEYSWKLGKADMQLASEAAFNRYGKVASVGELQPDGSFTDESFPGGNGSVTEDRYETVLTAGYPVSTKLTAQVGVGWEYSKLVQSGLANTSRQFWRPKGSATLAYAAAPDFDITFKVARTVGQLQFEDFLARAFLDSDNENAVNADLVPEQTWETDLTLKKGLGNLGSTQIRFFDRKTQDYIDVIPVEGGGEARGNIDSAHLYGAEWTSTFKLDRVGVKGAKIDLNVLLQRSSLIDPTTGERRQISGMTARLVDFTFRHDLPNTNWAYSIGAFHAYRLPYYRVFEYGQQNEGPVFAGITIENKDVMGMTVSASLNNILGAKNDYMRTVYDAPRDHAPIAYVEEGDRMIGPIFSFSVKGSF